jgi:hypothetical protein
MRFTPTRVRFGKRRDDEQQAQADGDLPRPHLLRLQARRVAAIKEAQQILTQLPGPGESLHALCTHRMDLAVVIECLLERLGGCERLCIGTLGYAPRNLRSMLAWLDAGTVGELALLASRFFRSHNGRLWETTVQAFHERKQHAACMHSHAKVIAMFFRSGERLSIEGSSNLCGNGSAREQIAIVNDPGLCEWHAGWILAMVEKHEGTTQKSEQDQDRRARE